MKRNLLPLLGIAFVVALAASGIFYGLFVRQLNLASEGAAKRQIVVAARPIDRGAVLKTSDVRLSPWAGVAPPGSVLTLDAAVGKTLFASIEENEPLTASRLSETNATGGLAIAKGMRAISVRVGDSSGLFPYLRAGNHVDVQVVQNRGTRDATLKTILQNVEVLSVQTPDGNTLTIPAVATLLTSAADADRVALADSGASIRLVLRNPIDMEEGARQSLALASLFHDARAAESHVAAGAGRAILPAAGFPGGSPKLRLIQH